jgi:hypothetical protein
MDPRADVNAVPLRKTNGKSLAVQSEAVSLNRVSSALEEG